LKPFLTGIALCAFVAIVVCILQAGPISKEGASASYVAGLIYDFQTLIGGTLAIAAAWWTVMTMERTDQAAAERHVDQVELALRGDRLAVERAVNPQMLGLRGSNEFLISLRAEMLGRSTLNGQLGFIVERRLAFYSIFNDLRELLGREQLRDGSKLFDGLLAFKMHWLENNVIAAHDGLLGIHAQFLRAREIEDAADRSALFALYKTINRTTDEVPVIVTLMEETATRYRRVPRAQSIL
jgi:hypothetical protein